MKNQSYHKLLKSLTELTYTQTKQLQDHLTHQCNIENLEEIIYRINDLLAHPSFSILEFLKKHQEYKVKITGYADNLGDDKANDKISKKRAANASLYLIKNGIKKDRIEIFSRGKHESLVNNKSLLNREKNRRIFVELYRKDKTIIVNTKKEK